MGNCVRQGSIKVGSIDKKKHKDTNTIKKIIEEADKIDHINDTTIQQIQKINKKTTINGTGEYEYPELSETIAMTQNKSITPDQPLKNKKSIHEATSEKQSNQLKRKVSQHKSIPDIPHENKQGMNGVVGGGSQYIEEMRLKQEEQIKQQINELNLEKNIVSSIMQLLKDYLSNIQNTKKYWLKIKMVGYSKGEWNGNNIGGSISVSVEYNTGEITKLRIIFSKDIEKSNYDLDTFVYYSQLNNPSLVMIQDFNFRISSKYMRYYILSESNYHETSILQMIIKQANNDKPQITSSSFRQMFNDLLGLLHYFSEVKFIHGGINPSNIYINKCMDKEGNYISKAFLDMSLQGNQFNRRNTKFKEFAFRKSSDLQMFAISMLSLLSSLDINSIAENMKKSIIASKLSSSSIISVDNDIRYTIYCILRGSDMILEYGASEIKNILDNSINYDNHLALNRPNQQKNSIQFCYFINNGCEINVYSFYTKWGFGYRIYENIKQDNKINIKQSYCSSDYLFIIYEIHDSSDLFISKINLRKKCLDNKSLNIIKSIADTLCKQQGVKNERELNFLQAFEEIDSKTYGLITSDELLQFAYDNKIKEIMNDQNQDFATVISYFDENDIGKLNYYEFRNMLSYIMNNRPFIEIEVSELVELPRHYQPSSIMKKGNYLYLICGQYQSLPTNKCFRYFIKDLKQNQEIQNLDLMTSKGFTVDSNDSKKIITWSWNENTEFLDLLKTNEGQQIIKLNINEIIQNQNVQDAHEKKNSNILQFENTQEMRMAMMSQKSISGLGLKDIHSTKSLGSNLKIARTTSIPINISVEQNSTDEKNSKNIMMNVYNIDKSTWSSCQIQENNIFKKQNFFLPLNETGQIIIFDKEDIQNAWLVEITLDHIEMHYLQIHFSDLQALKQMIKLVIAKKINVAFYENSLLYLKKLNENNTFYYCVFIINEETGVANYKEYELVSYLGSYDRVSKAPTRFIQSKKQNIGNNYSSFSMSNITGSGIKSRNNSMVSISNSNAVQKMKINRYNIEKIVTSFNDTTIYSAYRSSFPNIEFKLFQRIINNSTEKIDDVYEILKFLSGNTLQGRIPPIKDAFYVFDSTTSQIKLNMIYTNEDIGQSMAEIMNEIQQQKFRIKHQNMNESQRNIQNKKTQTSKIKNNSSLLNNINDTDLQQQSNIKEKGKRNSLLMISRQTRSGSNTFLGDSQKQKMKKEYPQRLKDVLTNLKNVLIVVNYMKQNRFYLKEASPHILISIKDGKYFSPMNFYHENTFTTLNSEIKEDIIKDNSIYKDYLSPQLLKAHEEGLCYNDICYNIHKSNIYSLGMIFLQYASQKSIRGLNRITKNNLKQQQIKLQIAINNLPYPKYVQDLFTSMLQINEEDRLTANEILDLIHLILIEHKLDIYFPQLESFSPFHNPSSISNNKEFQQQQQQQQQLQKSSLKMDFYYTLDNPNQTLYLGGKSLLLEFKKSFKINQNATLETKSIIGIVKFSLGFYAIAKYPTQPTENIPYSISKYIFIKLISIPVNPKVLQGTLISSLPQFTGREITSLNLANVDEFNVLIYGGEEISSIGKIDIKEIYLLLDHTSKDSSSSNIQNSSNPQLFNHDDEEAQQEINQKITRLDDLKNSIGKAQLISYDITSKDHRLFDYDNISDDDDLNNNIDQNIPERSELDEDDQDYQKINIKEQLYDDEEEEEKKESFVDKESDEISLQQQQQFQYSKKEIIKEQKIEHYIIDQALQQLSNSKQYISLQIIKTDYSVQQRYISIKTQSSHPINHFSHLHNKKDKKYVHNIQFEIDTLQYIPLNDSLIIGLDVQSSNAYLISLLTFKSLYLPIINDVPLNQFIKLKQIKKLSNKFYSIISQKSFLFIYQNENDLLCHTYEFDSEKLNLHLISQMILLPKYGINLSIQTQVQTQTTLNEQETLIDNNNNKIMLPQLTLKVKSSSDDSPPTIAQMNNLFMTKQGTLNNLNQEDKIPTPSTVKSMASQIEQILEENDEDDPQYQASDYKKKPSFQNQVFKTQKSKLGLIKQKDTIVDSSCNQNNISEHFENEESQSRNQDSYSEYSEEEEEEEEEKQNLNNQNTMDLQQIIQNKISQNQKLLLEKSLDVSPATSPSRLQNSLKFVVQSETSSNNNNNINTISNNENIQPHLIQQNKEQGSFDVKEQKNNIKLFYQEPIAKSNNELQENIQSQQSLQSLRQYLSTNGQTMTNQYTQQSFNSNEQGINQTNSCQGIYKYPSKDEIQNSILNVQNTSDFLQKEINQANIQKKLNQQNLIDVVQEESQDSHSLTPQNHSQTIIGINQNTHLNNQFKQQSDQSNNNILTNTQTQDITSIHNNENILQNDDFNLLHDQLFLQQNSIHNLSSHDEDLQFNNMLMVDYDE